MTRRFFSLRTKTRKQWQFAGVALGIGLVLGIIFAGLAYYITRGGWQWALYGFLLSLGSGALLAPLALLVRPTVCCRGCDGWGWIVDLMASGARCPFCGGGSFDYRSSNLEGDVPATIRHDGIAGAELVKKGRGRRSSDD